MYIGHILFDIFRSAQSDCQQDGLKYGRRAVCGLAGEKKSDLSTGKQKKEQEKDLTSQTIVCMCAMYPLRQTPLYKMSCM